MTQRRETTPATAEVSYTCPRGHVTIVRFSANALFEVPSTWDCAKCHQMAHRHGAHSALVDSQAEGDTSAWKALQARRTPVEAEMLLAQALAELRTNSLPTPPAPPRQRRTTK